MRILKHPLLKVIGYPFLCDFQLIILFTLNVYVYRKKKQPKVSPGLGENGVKLLLTWNFGSNKFTMMFNMREAWKFKVAISPEVQK